MRATNDATAEGLVARVAEAYERGDFGPLLESLDENVVWISASANRAAFRFAGIYRGRAGVLEVTSQIAVTLTFLKYRPREIICQGETVWSLVDCEIVPLGAKRPVAFEMATRFRIRGGRILEYRGFVDTEYLKATMPSVADAAQTAA